MRTAEAKLMIDVMMRVDVGRVTPVYGNHRGPVNDMAAKPRMTNQNLRLDGGFSVGGKPADSRAFRRRRCRMNSGIRKMNTRVRKHHSHSSDKPRGL